MQNFTRPLLLVVLSFFGVNSLQAQTTLLDQTLLTQSSFNSFTSISVTGNQSWNFSSIYGAVCNGYAAGQSFENEDWFVSPELNLVQTNNVKLTFSHTRGNASVLTVGLAEGWYKVFATANFTGNPTTTQWTELTGLNQNVLVAWQFISSGEMLIPESAKSATSRIAFRYMSSASQSVTWEIKNVKVTAETPAIPNTSTFKITNWNTEWLGCGTFGPTDETLQINNVAAAMLAMNSDVYCIQEVTNSTTNPSITTLINLLGSADWGGNIVPSTTNDCDQRQAIIYKKSRVQFVNATQLNSGTAAQGNSYYYNWSSGRYPAVYNLNLISGSNSVPVSIVNIHSKAEDGDAMSYTRRLGSSEALKTILDGASYSTKNLVVIGDFNDYLVGTTSSACNCTESPFKNFMDDTAKYSGVTQNVNDARWNRPIIENIILSNELSANYVLNSAAQEVSTAQSINNCYNTTSDHFPLTAQLQFSTLSNPEYSFTSGKMLTIYPNPAKDKLHFDISDLEQDARIVIYDLMGRQIECEKINTETVNVSNLPSGVYVLKIGNRFGRFVKE